MIIEAKTQDGYPAQKGDSVLCVWGNRYKCIGRINKINGPMVFSTLQNKAFQTYSIACADGHIRLAHAQHIQTIFKRWK